MGLFRWLSGKARASGPPDREFESEGGAIEFRALQSNSAVTARPMDRFWFLSTICYDDLVAQPVERDGRSRSLDMDGWHCPRLRLQTGAEASVELQFELKLTRQA